MAQFDSVSVSPAMAGAPVAKSLEILSQELTCSLCRRHYEEPKALACLHYFCQRCLRGLVPRGREEVACPECNSTTALPLSDVSQLPDVRFVNRLKELHTRMAMIQGREEAVCESCSSEEAAFFCRQCADFLCGQCATSHRRMTKKYPDHSVASLDQLQENGARTIPLKTPLPSRCASCTSGAQTQLCKTYCRDCRQLACGDCTATEHVGHRLQPAKKCASQYRRLLQQSLFPLRIISQQFSESLTRIANAKRDIASQGEHVEESIRTFFNEAVSLLEKEKQSLLSQSAKLVAKKLEALGTQEEEVACVSRAVQNVIEYCKQSVELVSDDEVLAMHEELENRVKEECVKHAHTSEQAPCETANIAVQTTGAEELVEMCRERARVYLFPCESNSRTHVAEVNKQTTHYVTDPSDPLFTPHLSSLTASLVSVVDSSTTQAVVTVVGKGMYQVCYTPRMRGRHRLCVKRDGKGISDAPLPVFATLPPKLLGTPIHSMEGLRHPYSAVFNAKNQLFVAQSGATGIQKFRRSGDTVLSKALTSQLPKHPTGMAVDSEGYTYVVNIFSHTLGKFDGNGKLVGEVGQEGSGSDELDHPSGVAVVGNRVYVCDRNNDRIKVYSKELKLEEIIGSHGRKEGEMNWPYDITGDENDLIYIADSGNHRVQVFDKSGKFVRSFGERGTAPGSLLHPTGLCVEHDGLLYVTEYGNHRVSVFQREGGYLGGFGSYGSGRGELCYPVGITMDRDGFVYVCDQGNNRIQVF